jgi:L-lysine 2,3-aminomutase
LEPDFCWNLAPSVANSFSREFRKAKNIGHENLEKEKTYNKQIACSITKNYLPLTNIGEGSTHIINKLLVALQRIIFNPCVPNCLYLLYL